MQCRGCEPACPSGVPYGRLIESTRAVLADMGAVSTRRQRLAFWALSRPHILRLASSLLAIAARLRLVPKRLGVPTDLPLTRGQRHTSGDDVYLFTGCVMDVWQRDVHDAGQRVLEAAGVGVTPTGDLAPCCGALHTHAGLGGPARERAEATITALSADDRPILVDSAGCGAAMKEYGHLLDTPEAEAFSARVYDIHEWLATRLDDLPTTAKLDLCVAVRIPAINAMCNESTAARAVLAPYVHKIIELDDDGLCCGAGGAFSVLHPKLATDIRGRKIDAIERVSPDIVASANPGCSLHLAAGGIRGRAPDATHRPGPPPTP